MYNTLDVIERSLGENSKNLIKPHSSCVSEYMKLCFFFIFSFGYFFERASGNDDENVESVNEEQDTIKV